MKKYSFTLSEVLIVLVILGVIAVLTVPSMIGNIQEASYITRMKKAFSVINNAITLAATQDGRILTMKDRATNAYTDIFKPNMKITDYKGGEGANTSIIFSTADGMVIGMSKGNTDECNSLADTPNDPCAFIIVDVNGAKAPNKLTTSPKKGQIHDQFAFPVFADGIMPKPNSVEAILLSHGPIKEDVSVSSAVCGDEPSWKPYENGALVFKAVPAYRFEGRGNFNCP